MSLRWQSNCLLMESNLLEADILMWGGDGGGIREARMEEMKAGGGDIGGDN